MARKRLLKKRTPDYVRSQKFAILYQELQRALALHCVSANLTNDCLTFLLLLTYKLLSNAAEFRSVGKVLSRLVAEAFLHFSLFILVFPHFPF